MIPSQTFGALTVQVGGVPPVYDPGGDTWVVSGPGSAEDFAAVEAAAREAGAVQLVAPKADRDVVVPQGFQAMSDFWQGAVSGPDDVPRASEDDLERLLELCAARRAAYAQVQPVFWREAPDARAMQETWFRHLLSRDDVRVLAGPRGILIALPTGDGWLVDDFAVVNPTDWATAGRRLLASLNDTVTVVCACHDEPKQALVRHLGLQPAYAFFQKALDAR